ncbi:hypothetical protein BV20DRAFT_1029827 [Pilatotrama ljubarskyi]|nr:hypothetical protein BV20DRAFT_1029827 [Pilatotrama ljubarskyi]
MSLLLIRPPQYWATGGEPMTDSQWGKLWYFHRGTGVGIPFVGYRRLAMNTQRVTKAEASILIGMFEDGLIPSDAYVVSLGQSTESYELPPHPSLWLHCNEPPRDMQLAWLHVLITKMHISQNVMQQHLTGITFGQASLLIENLRKMQKFYLSAVDGQLLFELSLEQVQAELPSPVMDEDGPDEDESKAEEDTQAGEDGFAVGAPKKLFDEELEDDFVAVLKEEQAMKVEK